MSRRSSAYVCTCAECRGVRPPAKCEHTAEMFPELARVVWEDPKESAPPPPDPAQFGLELDG